MRNILRGLQEKGFLKSEKGIKFDQIKKRLERSKIDLNSARLLVKTDKMGAYRMAYDSMLQAGQALILSYGYRPAIKGFHKTVVESTGLILGDEFSVLMRKFDQMRRNRHEAIYDMGIITDREASESIKIAVNFIKEISGHIKNNNPQKELL